MSQKKQQQFLALYQPVHERFERFCRARAYADMPYEDLIHESLLIAYEKLENLRNPTAFLSFLIGISIRVLSNAHKKNKRMQWVDHETILNQIAGQEDPMEQQNNVRFLHQVLKQLPEAQREALILFEITGFHIKEIAEIQQSSESAVKQRLARGRKALARIVKNELSLKSEEKP